MMSEKYPTDPNELLLSLFFNSTQSRNWPEKIRENLFLELLDKGLKKDYVFHMFGMSPIHFAHHPHMTFKMLKVLLETGSDPNFFCNSYPAIVFKLNKLLKLPKKLELLCEYGLNVNLQDLTNQL